MTTAWQQAPGAPSGWYLVGPGVESYWDGFRWTHQRPVRRVSHPATGWVLVGAAALMLIGSVTPWANALGGLVSAAGTVGDGKITLVLSLVIAGVGLPVALKRGELWAPIVALTVGLIALSVPFVDIADISRQPFLSVGFGLWLTAVAALTASVGAIVAMSVRGNYS